jgi:hypothetical protein
MLAYLLSPEADIATAWREQLSSPPRPPIALRDLTRDRFFALFHLVWREGSFPAWRLSFIDGS